MNHWHTRECRLVKAINLIWVRQQTKMSELPPKWGRHADGKLQAKTQHKHYILLCSAFKRSGDLILTAETPARLNKLCNSWKMLCWVSTPRLRFSFGENGCHLGISWLSKDWWWVWVKISAYQRLCHWRSNWSQVHFDSDQWSNLHHWSGNFVACRNNKFCML